MSRHKVVVRAFLTSDRRHPTSQSRTADSTRVFNTTCRSKVAPCLCRYLGTTGGYYCQGYSDAVAWPKKGWINLCEPGKETTRMLRALH